jgi:uncharacterized integral membrane protein
MGLLLTTIAAASVWIILVALGKKPFDALLVGILMILIAGTARVFNTHVANRRSGRDEGGYIAR